MDRLPQVNAVDLDLMVATFEVLNGLRMARQMAFQSAQKYPVFQATFETADAAYRDFAERIGHHYEPPVDMAAETEKRLTELKAQGQ